MSSTFNFLLDFLRDLLLADILCIKSNYKVEFHLQHKDYN